jgi:TRAP-type transport system periplasmic protein
MANIGKAAVISALLALGLAATEVSAQGAENIQNRVLRLATANPADHPQTVGAQKFADLVKERTGGKIQVRIFHSGTLGTDLTNISALQGGTLDLHIGTADSLMSNVPEFAAINLPFVFRTDGEVDHILAGPVGDLLFSKLPAKGIVGLGWMEQGFRVYHTTKTPIRKADDFKGLKLRMQQTSLSVAIANALGANAVSMPYGDTYTALEQGAIDGMDNPLINISVAKYYEINKHISITNHMYQPAWLGISKITWDKLSDTEKKIVREAGLEASKFQRDRARQQIGKIVDQLRSLGCNIYEFSPDEVAKMRGREDDVIAKFTKGIEPAVALLNEELGKYRRAK